MGGRSEKTKKKNDREFRRDEREKREEQGEARKEDERSKAWIRVDRNYTEEKEEEKGWSQTKGLS